MTAFEIITGLLVCVLWTRLALAREELTRLRGVVKSHDELVKRVHALEDAHQAQPPHHLDFDFVGLGARNTNGGRPR